ncbi:hypothetical protein S7335_1303 [Synechococcus sp. PCC 7335]|uniref:hypothetical protein n=1 Tax=Synechococcus sp. (strain ATCC 29403 / PCC 7335) TaxID=91464 RepID=UPI00017EB57A|nr:hypothetical protein [Synechococcus sp. PCC 7335]EDX82599.1 hypothetical protein S7335_1303 [Synechococcus sp. PCC 7335]
MGRGRPRENTQRVDFSILVEHYQILRADAVARGYISGNGVRWKEYFGAIAMMLVGKEIEVPPYKNKKVD